ncbi:putative tail tape measure protein [Sphingomonas phage vB_StuS_MMDA13]|uniref:Putative tail tape measure protein n=1 Tax=Sphingomonas phage vB_StuS_MMDA13 TaxID=2686378 RepID=A0A7G3PHG8_9CAUD|nr:putative tail tape measure protein [Sphingomonas phage vB_StuS_MMDA13]QHB80449.1 putative tail tape measure protein [Sphingomonas phage vB_StuS_MMDA13]
MAEERIDIEVTDKVDANAAKKINQIADAADRGFTYVEKLKAALAAVNTSSVDKLVSAMARADSAQAKLLNAQVRLTQAQDTGALAAAKLATQQQKLATEQARTEAATARAAAASTSAEAAAMRLANAQQRTTATAAATSTAEEQLAADLAVAKSKFDAGEISIRGYVAALQQARAAATGAAQPIVDNANQAEQASKRLEQAQSRTRSSNANIIAQLQDIGVSLAGGQNPLLVLIQQGSQLDYIARTTAGGWAGLVGQIVKMIAPLTVVAAAIGGLYLAYKNFTNEMAARHKPELEAYANSLGLTSKEMKKLSNETAGAGGKLKEFDVVTITAADSWNGFIATVKQGLEGLVAGWGPVNDYISTAWSATTNFLYMAFLGFYAAVHTLIQLIGKTAINVFKILANSVMAVANSVVMVIQDVVNAAISGINLLGDGANAVLENLGFDRLVPTLDKVNLGIQSITQNMFELESMDIGATFTAKVQEANNTIQGFKQAWDEAATAAAKARLAALAAAIIQNRGAGPKAKVDHTEERRALAIGIVNMKLDDELDRMKMLKDAREVQQRMDQIEESLAQKKITLNDAERASILAKVQAIQDYKYVQQESDRVMEEIQGPARTYAATQQALNDLLARGAITQDQFNQQMVLANRVHAEATDPLFQLKEAMDQATVATQYYGQQAEQAAYYEQIRQAMLAKGIQLSPTYVAGVNAEADALMRKNDQLRQQQFIQSQLAGVLDPILNGQREIEAQSAVYAELERQRQLDLINEDAYQQAKAALWVKYNEQKLQASSDFFGALADVTKKGTGVVGAISKAAAVAEATIQGYLAVQRALASMPPPFNYVAAAAVAIKTGANVAGILSTNAGSFATGGQFMVEGRSGVDANNINMNVTRGERVTVETPKQQRENDAAGNGSGQPPVLNAKIINSLDPRIALDAVDTAEGEQLIVNIITRNSAAVKRVLG